MGILGSFQGLQGLFLLLFKGLQALGDFSLLAFQGLGFLLGAFYFLLGLTDTGGQDTASQQQRTRRQQSRLARGLGLLSFFRGSGFALEELLGAGLELEGGGLQAFMGNFAGLCNRPQAGGLLQVGQQHLRAGLQDLPNLALSHNGVPSSRKSGSHQGLLDLAQGAAGIVKADFAAAVALEAPAQANPSAVAAQLEPNLGEAERGPAIRAVKEQGLGLIPPQLPGSSPHHPAQGLDQVALARAVGPHDAVNTRAKLEAGALTKRFKTL
ncbi:hypothetical protein Mcate_00879 [Meiothermus taiwanensis]|uniref:Uncharacterized protein n=1 Tax=Meiothermus taiwanensis TaxID=172827 RepID=A0A399E8Q9_9DEIN|nr:hypothetical protein Mcate_00879 [Meiothermus taiwanensis]